MTLATAVLSCLRKVLPCRTRPLPLSTHAQISVMYCLGTLVLDRLVSTPHLRIPRAYSTGVRAATSDEEGGAGTTWDRASKTEWARHGVPEIRSGYILDVRCITSKLRTGSGQCPFAAQVTHKSLSRDSNFLVPPCLFFLHQAFAFHLRKQLRLRKRDNTSVLWN